MTRRRFLRSACVLGIAAAAFVLAAPALGGTFTVNSAADTGGVSACDGIATCTLRQAIQAADDTTGGTITFAGSGPYLIQPATALPQITEPVTIDGSGAQVQVDGTHAAGVIDGLDFASTSFPSFVKQLYVTGWNRSNGAGIKVGSNANVTVTESTIGTDPSESSLTVGNYTGIEVDGTATIDGSGTGNLFTANTTGLAIFGTATVQGGYFGPAGGAAGNSLQAILIQSGSPSIQIGTGVTITGNGAGVRVLSPSTGIKILGNRIGSLDGTHPTNTGGGIVFGFDNGHTPNDTGDGDSGPNGLQNYPQLQGAYTSSGQLNVTGTLNSAANTDYTVQVFASGSCDSSGYGEGVDYLGDLAVHTDGSGNGSFSGSVFTDSGYATATVTGPDGTSEFSNCVQIANSPPLTYTVVSNSDTPTGACDGSTLCTLRDAVAAANGHAGPDTIDFQISGGGLHTIALGSTLTVSDSVTIDGTTQPGFAVGTPVIELTGSASDGLNLSGGQSTVRGLVIDGFTNQITVSGGAGHTIAGNFLATNAAGTTTNGSIGVNVTGADATLIGGTSAADRNYIGGTGVGVELAGGTGAVVEGNYIGLAPDETTQNNAINGIGVVGNGNTIGGVNTGQGNTIAVDTDGISISGSNNKVYGNDIGMTADESQSLGGDTGIDVNSGANNVIGADAGTGNAIGGMVDAGLIVRSGNNSFLNNFIGTNRAVSAAFPNGTGVRQLSGSTQQNVYAQNAVLYSGHYGFEVDGGAAAITTNTINSNSVAGVHVSGVAGILISENQIYSTTGPGIELVNGANHDQPAPVLSSATANGPNTEVVGSLSGATPGTQYQIQLFRSATCGSGSNPQGADFISNFDQTADGNGHFDFDASNNVAGTGNVITATAIAPDGSTSVFSACVTASGGGGNAQPGPLFTVNSEDNHDDGVCSDTDCTLSEAINAANAQTGLNTIHFDVQGSGQLTIDGQFPDVTDPVVIDGTTQPGISPSTIGVTLNDNGSAASRWRRARTDRRFGVSHSSSSAARMHERGSRIDSNGNTIAGNYFGLKATDAGPFGNSGDGIYIDRRQQHDRRQHGRRRECHLRQRLRRHRRGGER